MVTLVGAILDDIGAAALTTVIGDGHLDHNSPPVLGFLSSLNYTPSLTAEVCLFGSLARGDATGTSDVDVLIRLHHATEPDVPRRILTFLPYFDPERGTALPVHTRAELEQQLAA